MSDLKLRNVRFDLDGDDIPFLWNPQNPAFSLQANMISFMAIAFEKFIVAAVTEAIPQIRDPEALHEARMFLEQEAQHASWHRAHVQALTRRHPGLTDVLSDGIACFDRMTATRSLAFRLAFIADLEATFTPWFRMLLDNDEALFGGGDERVASLLLWHFVEEVEHRSSGLIIYNAVVPNRWYRTLVLPGVLKEINTVVRTLSLGFNTAVPEHTRVLDGRVLMPSTGLLSLVRNVPGLRRRLQSLPEVPDPYVGVDGPDRREAVKGLLASQTPFHDPATEKLPQFAQRWFDRYEHGDDVAHWYSSALAAS